MPILDVLYNFVIEEMGESDHIEALKEKVDLQSRRQSSAFVELTAVTKRVGRKTVHKFLEETEADGEEEGGHRGAPRNFCAAWSTAE